MKLVSDFDGIWTNQHKEAEYVWEFIINYLCEITNKDKNFMSTTLQECRDEMNKEPFKYGWINGEMIACYYHEDPFGDNNAIFDFVNNKGVKDENEFTNKLKFIRDSILKRYESLAKFSQDSFYLSTSKFKEEGKLNAVENTDLIVEKIKSLDTDIIIVSNSKTTKIEHVFEKAGIKAGTDATSQILVRGEAKKFEVINSFTELPEFLKINENISVALRRPAYYKILSEEKPDFVIGDVFSLDLALPLYLRLNDKRFSNLKVIQRVQKYTPDWVKDFLSKKELEGIAFLVNGVDELPEIISSQTLN